MAALHSGRLVQTLVAMEHMSQVDHGIVGSKCLLAGVVFSSVGGNCLGAICYVDDRHELRLVCSCLRQHRRESRGYHGRAICG